jgi:hypothetical protein
LAASAGTASTAPGSGRCPRQRAAVLLFSNVLTPGMNLPLFAKVVEAIDAIL